MHSIDFLPWEDSFDCGLPAVDAQHRHLVQMINALASHVAFRTDVPQLDAMFDELAGYAVYHFQTEESVWYEYLAGDEDEANHRQAHESFVDQVQRLRAEQSSPSTTRAAERTLAFLASWLISHILKGDRYMAGVVLALRAGLGREQARQQAGARMAKESRLLADLVPSFNATRTTNALHLISEVTELRRAQAELKRESEKNQALLRSASDGVHVLDSRGNIVEVSDSFCAMLGCSRAEVLGSNIARWDTRYVPDEGRPAWRPDATSTQRRLVRSVYRRKDGSLIDVDVNGVPLTIESQTLYFYSARDVSALVEMESVLKRQAEFTNCLVEAMGDGIGVCHDTATPPYVRFTVWNPAMQKLTGYSLSDVNEVGWQCALPVEEARREEARLRAERMRYGDHLRGEEWTIRSGSGERRTLQVHTTFVQPPGGGLHVLLVLRDISARKAAELLVQQQRDLAQFYLDTVQSLMLALDSEGRITMINRAGRELLGYTGDELLGRYWFTTCLPQDKGIKHSLPLFRRVIAGELKANLAGEDMVICRDGSQRLIGWKTAPLIDDAGHIVGTLSSGADITERRAAEEELERYRTHLEVLVGQRTLELSAAKEAAETANRAKSDFLSSMSHELRTPMNAIIGFAQMLEYDGELNANQRDSVQEILKASRHLLDLINEVLDLSRIESGRIELSLEATNVAAVVDDCRHLVEPLAAPYGIVLVTDVPDGTWVTADRVRLKQALLNLLSNAVKYNREQGRIHLVAQARQSDGGPRISISVADTGIGIAAERLNAVFQPFTRLVGEQSEIEGTGIGLTITQRLIELMGGEIGAESELGVGSRFWIDLPSAGVARHDDPSNVSLGARTQALAASDERRVLCIDDNPSNLKLMTQILGRRTNLRLLAAHAPHLGIELALAHRPHLILLDINMPGMDGYQVLAILRHEPLTRRTPVIAITANALARDIERGRAARFRDYIIKPIDVTAFLRVVEDALQDQP
ncbi:MAG: bacteriohemerythrin [Candidatus Accumulibacter sp.]|uniref:bacteriohemerythrin n=1 Tax=Accumulibacter sp. TaxID=2053492 RepID=UPI0028782349|nr:bacteriohemerythrin [Accumulibacter sp.]MDS4015964.1 bacteriohemerythrin [Accumulibacter sp.]